MQQNVGPVFCWLEYTGFQVSLEAVFWICWCHGWQRKVKKRRERWGRSVWHLSSIHQSLFQLKPKLKTFSTIIYVGHFFTLSRYSCNRVKIGWSVFRLANQKGTWRTQSTQGHIKRYRSTGWVSAREGRLWILLDWY